MGAVNSNDSTMFQIGQPDGGSANDDWQVFVRDQEGASPRRNATIGASDGNWHHLAFTWENADQNATDAENFTFFVDGDIISEGGDNTANDTEIGDAFTDWDSEMAIGARNVRGALEGAVEAQLDDFRIYDNALSESDVESLVPTPGGLSVGLAVLGAMTLFTRRSRKV